MEEKSERFKRIFNACILISAVLYVTAIIVISAISAHFERNVFISFGFEGYLLILGLITIPFAVSLFGAALIVKESVLYKKFDTKKERFTLLVIAYSLITLIGVLAVIGYAFYIIDIILICITILAIIVAVLITVTYRLYK